jgi:type I restriction-modification system DNA methylase subunit
MARTTTTLERPRRRLTQAELDAFLDKAADILRGNVDHSEFRGYVLALLFFKRLSDVYLEELRNLTERLEETSFGQLKSPWRTTTPSPRHTGSAKVERTEFYCQPTGRFVEVASEGSLVGCPPWRA